MINKEKLPHFGATFFVFYRKIFNFQATFLFSLRLIVRGKFLDETRFRTYIHTG